MIKNSDIIQRLTILWACTECGLGGFFHAIQSPFTGLIVGGLSVTYISLIAYYSQDEKTLLTHFRNVASNLLKALVFVLTVKAVASPHSPVGAYFAVAFQCLIGIALFGLIPYHKLATLLSSTISLAASAVQKVVILIILFGVPFFQSIDQFILDTANKFSFIEGDLEGSTSLLIACVFLSIYALGGLVIGFMAASIPQGLEDRKSEFEQDVAFYKPEELDSVARKRKRPWFIIVAVCLFGVAFLIQYMVHSLDAAFEQLFRTLIAVFIWVGILNPLIKWIIRSALKKKTKSLNLEIKLVLNVLPQLVSFARYSWIRSKEKPGFRLKNWLMLYLFYGLYNDLSE